jgi:MFS family permease
MSPETNPPVVSPNEAPAALSLSSRRGVAILLLLCLVQFMDVLDASILNIALPSIKDDLGFSQQSLCSAAASSSSPAWWCSPARH